MTAIGRFSAGFREEPGFLDYATHGPLSAAVLAEVEWQKELLSRSRFGSVGAVHEQSSRARAAVAEALAFRPDQIALQPDAATGAMHAMFGLTGGVLLSEADHPALTYAAVRAEQALSVTAPIWLETDHGRVTPGQLRDQLTSTTVAVAVSAVDESTGFVADLDGIRQVIGDRLLIVDVSHALGVVGLPYEVADAVLGSGHAWLRAGWGTGFLALSDRALERLTPVFSGPATDAPDGDADPRVQAPPRSASAYRVGGADPLAAARLAAALEDVAEVGVPEIARAVAEKAARVLDVADAHALPVVSPREEVARAGIVVLEPPAERLTLVTASLHNHGVAVRVRAGRIGVSVHAGTAGETLDMLRAAFGSAAAAGAR